MPAIASLYEPIARDLEKVCRIFDDELFSDLPAVNDLCEHVRLYRGKMLRPSLLLLSARACGRVTDEHLTLAAVVEMVHMATLVHDDVLDEADMRRRRPTINRLQGNEAAVLFGDYLISHAFHLCCSLDSTFAARKIGEATNIVCEGELQQVYHRGNDDLSLDQYLDIITRKTATLTGTACLLGAHYADAPSKTVAALERYGLDVGIAFQITDDVLDITGSQDCMGKTLGRDLAENKLTLPIIHGLSHGEPPLRERIQVALDSPTPDRAALAQFLAESGSIEYALRTAARYVDSALDHLDAVPSGDTRDLLARLARLIINRET